MGRIDRRNFVVASAALVGASFARAQPAKSSGRSQLIDAKIPQPILVRADRVIE